MERGRRVSPGMGVGNNQRCAAQAAFQALVYGAGSQNNFLRMNGMGKATGAMNGLACQRLWLMNIIG